LITKKGFLKAELLLLTLF